jgi:hypothetical protein
MTTETKNSRRAEWEKRNFAGSIDWAVDLQSFTADEYNEESLERPSGTTGCVMGEDVTVDSGSLCAFSCMYGFCPETLCECIYEDEMLKLPAKQADADDIVAYDLNNVDLNRLCKWACQYGYCPDNICIKSEPEIDNSIPEVGEVDNYYNTTEARLQNAEKCVLFKDPEYRDVSVNDCKKVCKDKVDAAQAEGRTTNYGCIGFFPGAKEIPWEKPPGAVAAAPGRCMCDNWLLNEIADTVLEALPMIAQVC